MKKTFLILAAAVVLSSLARVVGLPAFFVV